jgi:hypothetical protein
MTKLDVKNDLFPGFWRAGLGALDRVLLGTIVCDDRYWTTHSVVQLC